MVVVDSGVWIDLLAGHDNSASDALARLLHHGETELILPDLVLYEVMRGFRLESDLRTARSLFAALPVAATGGADLALRAAEHYRHLRRLGITVRSALDTLIASFCIERGHALLHRDRDFDAYATHLGLQIWPHLS